MLQQGQVMGMLAFLGDRSKRPTDLSYLELYQGITTVYPMHDKSFRRVLKGLGVGKNDRGCYTHQDAVVVLGWMKFRDRYASYAEYMECCGKLIYEQAKDVDFSNFSDFGGSANAVN